MNTELQLQGYASIDEGVYAKGKIHRVAVPSYREIGGTACIFQRKRHAVPVLVLQRFSHPTFEEVLKYLGERSSISLGKNSGVLHYVSKQRSSRRLEEKIDEYLRSLSGTVVNAIMRKKQSVANFLKENISFIASENQSLFPQYFLEASYGYLPKSTISNILRSGEKPGANWYIIKLTKVARETEAHLGIQWAVEFPFYYDAAKARMRVNGDGTIVAANRRTKPGHINKVLREIHEELDEHSWKMLPNKSDERVREAAYEGLNSLGRLLIDLSEPE